MTPATLDNLAHQAVANGLARVTISVPKGWRAPAGFPTRALLSVGTDGSRNYSVSAARLAAWCRKARLL